MFHLIWYIIVGLIAGVIAKSIMHVHLKLLWTGYSQFEAQQRETGPPWLSD
jgi:hypothetical protein